jgi:uncharacterized protein (DUF2267 family)
MNFEKWVANANAFINEVAAELGIGLQDDGRAGVRDFPNREDAHKSAVAVLSVMSRHVAGGEMDDIERSMPRPIRRLIEEARRAA